MGTGWREGQWAAPATGASHMAALSHTDGAVSGGLVSSEMK